MHADCFLSRSFSHWSDFTIFTALPSCVFSDVGMHKADNMLQAPSLYRSGRRHDVILLANSQCSLSFSFSFHPFTDFFCNVRVLHFRNAMSCVQQLVVVAPFLLLLLFHIVIHATCKLNEIHRIKKWFRGCQLISL